MENRTLGRRPLNGPWWMIVVLMDHRENEMVLEEQENDEISKTRLCSELGVVLACSWSVVFSEEEASRVGLGLLVPAVWSFFFLGAVLHVG